MHGIVLEEIEKVVLVHERIVDGGDLGTGVGGGGSEDESTDSAEAVDSDSSKHLYLKFVYLNLIISSSTSPVLNLKIREPNSLSWLSLIIIVFLA